MTKFLPFAPNAQETTIRASQGHIIVASDDEKISLSGDVEFQRDQQSLRAAKDLRAVLDSIIKDIEEGSSSFSSAETQSPIVRKKNPFR